jgi:diguanylate cyclase (GGDEF)-like protein
VAAGIRQRDVGPDRETPAGRAPLRRVGRRASVWHYLVAIALLPCVGVATLAGFVAANRVGLADDAKRIEQSMTSIRRLDELRVAVTGEASALAVDNTLAALGVTAEQARLLGGFRVTVQTPAQAARATDAALTAVAADATLAGPVRDIRAQLAAARAGPRVPRNATPAEALGVAWSAVQSFQRLSLLIADAQSSTTDAVVTGRSGAGSRRVLRAADQLRNVNELVLVGSFRSTYFYLTYLAPPGELPAVRTAMRDNDAAYRMRATYLTRHLSPELVRRWQAFSGGQAARQFDGFVAREIARAEAGGGTPPLQELFVTGQSLAAYDAGLSDLLAAAVADGAGAAAADRSAATDRARATVAATAVLLLLTVGALFVLGGRIRRRLSDVADAAQRLSAGTLETMPVRGPREIALASAGLNDAVRSLQQVAATAERLAAGDLDAPELRRPTSGPLGAAVHASVVLLTDAIRERQRLQQELAHQAAHDGLTGLPNRLEAERLLAGALETAEPGWRVGLLFVDLDHFKQVNDTYGHHAGDHVLQVSAARMVAEVRDSDTVCRLGGDEFVVILDPAESDQVATAIGRRIVESVGRPITYDGAELRVGASVGVAVTDAGAAGPEELLTRADHAVYRAKADGRNRVAF